MDCNSSQTFSVVNILKGYEEYMTHHSSNYKVERLYSKNPESIVISRKEHVYHNILKMKGGCLFMLSFKINFSFSNYLLK